MQLLNFIAGTHQPAASGEWLDVIEPATGKVYAQLAHSDARDVEAAVAAARAAWPAWKHITAAERAAILHRLATLIEARMDDFAQAESRDNGKPISLASSVDIPRAIANLRAFADAATKLSGEQFVAPASHSHTERSPIGLVATISPWNLPLLLFTWKVAPALAAGNCVIAKPSEITPLSAFMLSELINEAGFPPGVFNIVHGLGASVGAALTAHPAIGAVSFTGGTMSGRAVYQSAAATLKKVSLELGGKNPTLIFPDTPWEQTLKGVLQSAFANQGQVCLCGSRILIHRDIYDRFRDDFVALARTISIGDPMDPATQHGATVSESHLHKVLGYIELAQAEGGRILTGGKRRVLSGRCEGGYFIEPTIIEGLSPTCRTNQEEIFGPVVTLIPFADEAEAIAIANGTDYGLAASVWTADTPRAARIASAIDAGIVWVNCWNLRDLNTPFGGVKQSGVGREGIWRALQFFTEEKTITRPIPSLVIPAQAGIQPAPQMDSGLRRNDNTKG